MNPTSTWLETSFVFEVQATILVILCCVTNKLLKYNAVMVFMINLSPMKLLFCQNILLRDDQLKRIQSFYFSKNGESNYKIFMRAKELYSAINRKQCKTVSRNLIAV